MLCIAEALILLLKLTSLALLTVEHLGNLHTREVLGEEGIDVGGGVLYASVRLTREFTEDNRKQQDKGHEAKHHQGQELVDKQHCRENAHDNKAVLDKVYQKVGKHHGNCSRIVTNSGNELTYGHGIKLTVREALDMSEHVLTKRGKYLLTDFLQNNRLQIGGNQRYDKNTCVNDNVVEERLHLKSALNLNHTHDITHNYRGNDVVGDGYEHNYANQDKLGHIGLCIP